MPKRTRADETIPSLGTSKGTSLRTTVPLFIIGQLELKKGMHFRWGIKGNQLVVEIVKYDGRKDN